ncbi:MAG: alpha/beta fold hydrolase [Planctomycetes bacterium]|nr:alpha/beta fold hydrolase [Planctomycetota bacterium]
MTLRCVVLTFAALLCIPTLGQERQTVTFETRDGVEIFGDYFAPQSGGSPVVILLHMYRSNRSAWRPLVPALHKAGFAVLAIDLRGHGESLHPSPMQLARRVGDRDETVFGAMHRDVAAAYVFLDGRRKVDMSRVALVGASVGCSVAIDYAARDRSVDVVVCMTPGVKYLGVDSTGHIRKYGKRPILLLATSDERQACDTLGAVNPSATAAIVGSGRIHGTRMFGKIKGIEKRIVSFLLEHIGEYSQTPVAAAIDGDEYFAFGSREHMDVPPDDVRWFSTIEEARGRGLSGPDSPYEGRIGDFPLQREFEVRPYSSPPRVPPWLKRKAPPQQDDDQDP